MIGLGSLDLTPILELRERYEHRVDRDFSDRTDDGIADLFGRYRAGLAFRDGRVSGQFVYQYSHDEDQSATQEVATRRRDAILAFAKVKTDLGDLTLGRQRLIYGSERLLGQRDFNNVELCLGRRPVYQYAPRPLRGEERGGADARQHGLPLRRGHRDPGGPDPRRRPARHPPVGGRPHGGPTLPRGVRAGAVRGGRGRSGWPPGRAGRARGGAGRGGDRAARASPRLLGQASVASGGRRTGTSNTFDPLYPSTHDHYGLLDLAQWENLLALGAWLAYAPERRTGLKLEYHHLELDSARDAWYTTSGTPYRRPGGSYLDPTGRSGRDLGDEVDLDASRTLDAHSTVRAGFGVFDPGRFVRSFEGSATRHQTWGYVQYSYRF